VAPADEGGWAQLALLMTGPYTACFRRRLYPPAPVPAVSYPPTLSNICPTRPQFTTVMNAST
jgi:hypothetical protein